MEIAWALQHPNLCVGWVEALGVTIQPSPPEFGALLDEALARRAQQGQDEGVKQAIRDLLRVGGYKPSGRGKPASEYLAEAASKGTFPRINNVVDLNNLLSLETGWPMSALDRARVLGLPGETDERVGLVELRFGRKDERYVFNSVGQEIDLEGLVCVARRGGQAVGNPVKDAMAAKTHEQTRDVLAALYATRATHTEAQVLAVAQRYAELLSEYAGALHVRAWTQTA